MRKLLVICSTLWMLLGFPAIALGANALVVHDGSAVSPGPDIRTQLASRLTAKGYTVTQNVGVPAGSLATYQQIWDLRYSTGGAPPGNSFTSTEVTSYLTFLQGGGSLFLMGENGTSFGTRNTAIADFVQSAGGGSITLASTTSNSQTVQAPFTGPSAVNSVTYQSVGGALGPLPKGAFLTKDASNNGAAIGFGPGVLSNATAGTLIAVFDVNFLQSTAASALKSLADNMIDYLGAPPPPASADLGVTLTQSISAPLPGVNLTYTVVVTNNGAADASTVVLSDSLPTGMTFVSATAPSGWALATPAVGANGTVTATLATLTTAAGAQTVTITALVGTLSAGTVLTNSASVTSATTDPSPANNTSSVNATVATSTATPASIPTLGEWAMLLMASLLAGVGALSLTRRQGGTEGRL